MAEEAQRRSNRPARLFAQVRLTAGLARDSAGAREDEPAPKSASATRRPNEARRLHHHGKNAFGSPARGGYPDSVETEREALRAMPARAPRRTLAKARRAHARRWAETTTDAAMAEATAAGEPARGAGWRHDDGRKSDEGARRSSLNSP
jgi:hypothetical protein